MQIKQLLLTQFKNYKHAQFNFTKMVNCFVGLNGAGKTNVLDAIYFLAFTKSYFNHQDLLSVMFDTDFFSLEAELEHHQNTEIIRLVQQVSQKKVLHYNNNPVKKFSEHIGTLPLIKITPTDILLAAQPADERRKFIDGFISQFNKTYLANLLLYNRVLEQRNKLLKDFAAHNYLNQVLLDSYNEQLANHGNYLHTQRVKFIEAIIPIFSKFYSEISSGDEVVNITYESIVLANDFDLLLIQNQQIDIAAGRTTQGIHKDDFIFTINQNLLKRFGSQGQQKSFIIALKLAQYNYLKNKTQKLPLLLLDDIFEKLDNIRLNKLLQLIADNYFGQIFITHTSKEMLLQLFEPIGVEADYFTIENGVLKK